MNVVALQFETTANFQNNLDKLISLINQAPYNTFVLAPELCLNGYAYDKLDEAVKISQKAIKELKKISTNKTIVLTLTLKHKTKYTNTLHIFNKNNIIHTQSKVKLFTLNNEQKYFKAGYEKDIKIVKIGNLKIANLICFELRFIKYWQKLKGADIILIPTMWGKSRKEHLKILAKALAITNQCFVIISNSANDKMAKGSAIINPFGEIYFDDTKEILSKNIDLKEIKKIRRYIKL
jgi:predicted amidohydrolase